ncbi:amino acid permease [Acetobacter conturbans]|uniref:Amino acid permease n=1 Tax=Acetobacter conturbans TaxID=1737472 RepID=A0ABX0K2V9_9PROT|nr:amino acid permease [Acetobacter conturbans]NHN89005.1 amino acid permease [Acetobacter conturbans]
MEKNQHNDEDAGVLASMGYTQELSRSMKGFSNFAISFSIICILAGGITSFQLGFSSLGGFGVAIGWIVGTIFATIVACSMGQIASAYPTAGGLYHWSSILGGRGWGWATAWVNLLGLVFVLASVNVGAYTLFVQLILGKIFGMDVSGWGYGHQLIGVLLIASSQALFNHVGIKITKILTDFSGYLILFAALLLTVMMLYCAPGFHWDRLLTIVNNTGAPGGNVFPRSENLIYAFCLALILPAYTITGFDASAHVAEETIDARNVVPRGMINAVLISGLFGFIMVCSFVLAMPDPTSSAAQGGDVFFNLLAQLPVPSWLRSFMYVMIVAANYLCALAGMTSTSRMVFAFGRDGGLPGSKLWRYVSPVYRTPVPAIWLVAILSCAVTLYSSAFAALAAGCAIFLYVSYAMPIGAGILAQRKRNVMTGPFRLGALSTPFAVLTVIGSIGLVWIGIQPPNDILISYVVGIVVVLLGGWFLVEKRRFKGPPLGGTVSTSTEKMMDEEIVQETAAGA